jgi:hypothetical protein
MAGSDNLPSPPGGGTDLEAFGPSDPDYDAILSAVMETARGRWFLVEYARRNRTADTRSLLAVLDRIESLVRSRKLPDLENVRDGIGEIAEALAEVRREIAAGGEDRGRQRFQDVDFAAEAERTRADLQTVLRAGERIQEIAWGLREREVSPDLCDALDRYAVDILSSGRSAAAGVRGMASMARALRRIERRLDGLEGTLAEPDRPEPATRVDPAIHKADPAAGRFLEDFELVEGPDVQWTDSDSPAPVRLRPMPAPRASTGAAPRNGEAAAPEPVPAAAAAVAADPAGNGEARPSPEPRQETPQPHRLPEPQRRMPSDLTGLTFDQRMILFS